ncbi:hypothetical protein CQW23_27640 [Capsicum baccatum]|uniref:Uncharacterized protein n=1 Tax=Capsicum baccatum TaxID=33114 RepID=A0A2G2VE98_CAPBA|nr:hypothetical protein CQW23_27640 [Capsicum baccatum]
MKKTMELSVLCIVKACTIMVDADGMVETWPRDRNDRYQHRHSLNKKKHTNNVAVENPKDVLYKLDSKIEAWLLDRVTKKGWHEAQIRLGVGITHPLFDLIEACLTIDDQVILVIRKTIALILKEGFNMLKDDSGALGYTIVGKMRVEHVVVHYTLDMDMEKQSIMDFGSDYVELGYKLEVELELESGDDVVFLTYPAVQLH